MHIYVACLYGLICAITGFGLMISRNWKWLITWLILYIASAFDYSSIMGILGIMFLSSPTAMAFFLVPSIGGGLFGALIALIVIRRIQST